VLSHVNRIQAELFRPTDLICTFHQNYDDQMENQMGGLAARVGNTRRAPTAQQAGQSAS